ncbi:MAG: c-type cytochrome domain-containing protein [Myxococcota bacterium]
MTQPLNTRSNERARTFVHRTRELALLACTSLAGVSLSGCVSAALDDYGPGEGGTGGSEDGGADELDGSGGESEPSGDESGTNGECVETEQNALAVLEASCAGCHGPSTNTAGFGFVTDRDKLLHSEMIVKGQSADSPMFQRIADGTMPPASAPNQPSAEDIAVVREWIDSCIDDSPPACADQEWISVDTMIDLMLADIATVPAPDRPFTRYLTLTHLHNIGMCNQELNRFRFGLNKAINSLSLDPFVTRPEAIDEQETIYRIDLRDYDWEAAQELDKWELLIDNNPYAFQRVDDDAVVLQEFTQTTVPFMPADWLVHDASEPPLYYDMVDIPESLDQLETQLGIDIDANIENNEVARSGFLESGVSQNNRMFERHQLLGNSEGAFWLSYDFASNTGDQNLLANPLDFDEDGGEAIYNLPNGLQAYVITDALGNRLDEAPIAIVSDLQQPDRVVRAGISCMSCHDQGLKLKNDELLAHVTGVNGNDFDQVTKDTIELLHPPHDEMKALIDQGNETFNNAVAQLWDGPTEGGEPIMEVFTNFEDTVDLARAAAELGIEPDALSLQLGKLDPTYAPLASGSIARDTFEDRFAESVCILNIGVADDPECGS